MSTKKMEYVITFCKKFCNYAVESHNPLPNGGFQSMKTLPASRNLPQASVYICVMRK